MKIAVVFWSQTGNTEIMANKVAEGAQEAGAQVDILTPDAFSAGAVSGYDAIAFGCPAMGDEVLEEAEFEPMFADVEGALGGKKIALFGSYGWGDGQWMRDWEADAANNGVALACESVICNEAPDDEANAALEALAKALA